MPTKKPNLLFIVCDDLGWGDLSIHGNEISRTPNLDRVSRNGVNARRHLSGPLCSPARAAIMTGCYSYRNRVVDTYCGRSIMDPAAVTLADLLRQGGYRTGCFGKWHLGDCAPFRPEDRGFEETLWHLGGGIGQPGDFPANYGRESYFDPVLCGNGVPIPKSGYCSDIFTNATIDFFSGGDDRPWFAYLGFNAPHTPLQVDREAAVSCASRGATGDLPALYAMVENIDANVGRLLSALEETGQLRDTLLVFTSDHGPCPGVRDGEGRPRFNSGLRGQKGSVYEGGIRVPALWHWPEGLPQGKAFDSPTHAIDVMPTFLAAGEVPEEIWPEMDGLNLLPLMNGRKEAASSPDRTLFVQWHRGDLPVPFRNAAAATRNWKWVSISEAGSDELYDIEKDPEERRDLAAAHPEIVKQFREAYARWFSEVSSPHDFAPLRIPVGETGGAVLLTRQDWRVLGQDGWDSSTKAFWPLRIAHAGAYELSVEFETAPPERGVLAVACGEATIVAVAIPYEKLYQLKVSLNQGDAPLTARWQTTFQEGAPLYITVRPAGPEK
jgi:arylsulfatase A-like enzyme